MDPKECALFRAFWQAVLSQDADEIARRFEACGVLRFGKDRSAQGRQAVRHEFVRLFSQTAAIHHRPVSMWARDGVVVADADVAFDLDGERHVEIPVTTVCWFRGDGIARCEFSFYPESALSAA
jgi:hypothetical protein